MAWFLGVQVEVPGVVYALLDLNPGLGQTHMYDYTSRTFACTAQTLQCPHHAYNANNINQTCSPGIQVIEVSGKE